MSVTVKSSPSKMFQVQKVLYLKEYLQREGINKKNNNYF